MKLHFIVRYSGLWLPLSCIGDIFHWFQIIQGLCNVAYFGWGVQDPPISIYILDSGVSELLLHHYYPPNFFSLVSTYWCPSFFLQDLMIYPLVTLQPWVQQYLLWSSSVKVTFIFVELFFLVLSLPCHDRVCLGHLFDLVPQYLISLCQMINCFLQLFHMDLVQGCVKCNVIERGGFVPSWDHSVRAVIFRLSCDQLLGELEVMIFICKKILNSIYVCLFTGFSLRSFQA